MTIILLLHNLLRWAVLGTLVWALFRSVRGLGGRGAWDGSALTWATRALNVQFLLGIAAYATSHLVRGGLSDMGTAMRDAGTRFYLVEHPMMGLLALGLVHIAGARVRKAPDDAGRFRVSAIFLFIALLAVLARMPWARPFLPHL